VPDKRHLAKIATLGKALDSGSDRKIRGSLNKMSENREEL
jgi:hypothetical protein